MTSKAVYELLLRSYEQFKVFSNFEKKKREGLVSKALKFDEQAFNQVF